MLISDASLTGPQTQQPPRNGGSINQNMQPQSSLQQQQQNESILNGNQNVAGGGQNSQKVVMRDNLHYAADSVSNAMTSLVRELNSGADSCLVSIELS